MKNPFNLSEIMEAAQASQSDQQLRQEVFQANYLDLLRDISLYLRDISDSQKYINANLQSLISKLKEDLFYD